MKSIKRICSNIKIPKMIPVEQVFQNDHISIGDIQKIVAEQLSRIEIASSIKPNMRIAITCGSRGISNIDIITRYVVEFVKSRKALPFVFPAMGSHGGATAEGQKEVLYSYGITEDYLGCPVLSSMDVVKIGVTEENHDVFIDKYAAMADGIIVVGRIKPHTCFNGAYESGIMKMMAIGMGKQIGASVCHAAGFGLMHRYIPMFGKAILKNAPIICGIGIIENALHKPCKLIAMIPDEIITDEPKYLNEAKQRMPKIHFQNIDVLIIDRMGKDISGDGNDPYISGTFSTEYVHGGVNAKRVVTLDLTEKSHGNAAGVGMLDVITKRLYDKIDLEKIYVNAITSSEVKPVKIPMIAQSDELAIQIALHTCNNVDMDNFKVVRISDTLNISRILISEALIDEAENNPNIVIRGTAEHMEFDDAGNLF